MTSVTVRDPIHGMIPLEEWEWRAVDTEIFQRLRSIKQLAMTHLVYPGSTHTRFEHSIGTCHVAGKLLQRLSATADDRRMVRCATLLHDIGHGPFSHVSEQIIDERSRAKGLHEAISAEIVRTYPAFEAAFGQETCEGAARLVGLEGGRSYIRDIVSGPSDADKFDYLLRDSYFAGVEYGKYDLERILDSVRPIMPEAAESYLGFDADGVWALEGLLLARHHMHRQVYGHKTRLATDIMITRAIKYGIEDGVLPADAYTVEIRDGTPQITQEFLEAYLRQTDSRVLDRLCEDESSPRAHDLANRLICRNLLRQTVSIRLDRVRDDIGGPQYANVQDPDRLTRERILEFEGGIAADLGCEPHLVAISIDAQSNPTYRQPGTSIRPKDVMVQRPGAPPDIFQRESEIFRTEARDEHTFAYLYTPDLGDDARQRAKGLLMDVLRQA